MRTKSNRKYWLGKILLLFKQFPKSQLTEYRWQSVRACLLTTHPWIEQVDKQQFIDMLANADYVARKMRFLTEGQQKDKKEILSQEFIVSELQ